MVRRRDWECKVSRCYFEIHFAREDGLQSWGPKGQAFDCCWLRRRLLRKTLWSIGSLWLSLRSFEWSYVGIWDEWRRVTSWAWVPCENGHTWMHCSQKLQMGEKTDYFWRRSWFSSLASLLQNCIRPRSTNCIVGQDQACLRSTYKLWNRTTS